MRFCLFHELGGSCDSCNDRKAWGTTQPEPQDRGASLLVLGLSFRHLKPLLHLGRRGAVNVVTSMLVVGVTCFIRISQLFGQHVCGVCGSVHMTRVTTDRWYPSVWLATGHTSASDAFQPSVRPSLFYWSRGVQGNLLSVTSKARGEDLALAFLCTTEEQWVPLHAPYSHAEPKPLTRRHFQVTWLCHMWTVDLSVKLWSYA